ncbi:MAG TPA: hypothetical protein DHW02_09365 [Ktedonobacter sp.]|nr:hypothetical protein [Ktedonobacter sp.]
MASYTLPAHLRNLTQHLQLDEQVQLNIPGIWITGRTTASQQSEQQKGQDEQSTQSRSTTCDIVLTNQRLLGYAHIRFPRERLFLESFPLNMLKAVSLRQKSHEPLFHELLISDGQRRAYIRSSRPKIEQLYEALRTSNTPLTADTTQPTPTSQEETPETSAEQPSLPATVYGRQDIRRPFDQSPLGITILFIGGLLLEILGVILWSVTQSPEIGIPLCIAGFVGVIAATTQRRRHRM